MVAALCYAFLGLIVLMICVISVPLIGFVWGDEIREYLNDVAAKTGTKPFIVAEAIATAWISIAITTGLCLKFDVVILLNYRIFIVCIFTISLQQFNGIS